MIFYKFIKSDGVISAEKIRAMDMRIVYFASAIYVLLVKLVIPWVMKNRKPFVLKRTIIVYNLLISFLNGLLAYHMFCYLFENWNIRCTVKNAPKEVKNNYITKGFNLIACNAFMKFIEWFDTIFFALRKKNSQITHLHVIHHTGIALFPFYFSKLELPTFSYVLGSNINCTMHVLMYLYYGLAAIGPHVQKYLWWKKYLTMIQIAQFVVIMACILFGFITGCSPLGSIEMGLFVFVLIIMLFFLNFYVKSYSTKTE